MDKRIEELVYFTKEKFGLHQYNLHAWDIYRSSTLFKDTVYTLSMEWFPNHIVNWEDEILNPEGTVCIEIDIHSRKTKRVIFTNGISAVDSISFDKNSRDEIIKWIENETGLNYGRQFVFWKEKERELHFRECINGVAVSPSGSIELKLDDEGRLILFSVFGQFPPEKLVIQEQFSLSIDQIKPLVMEQLKLIEFPNIEQQKLVPAYAFEEIYIKNNGHSTLPFAPIEDKLAIQMDKVIEWDVPSEKAFQSKQISFTTKVTPEQAFQREPDPNLRPITDEEINECVNNVITFLSQQYSNDSGKWVLKSLYRDNGYIHATLTFKEQKERVFIRKLKLIIDSETYQVLNYMDNKSLLGMYMNLKATEKIEVSKEEAYKKLRDFIELTPCYVYDVAQGNYVLCGKLDCQYAVKVNGEVVALNEL